MAEEFVKQHIVPKRYLDRFATPTKKGKRLIGVRLKDNKEVKFFESTTDNIGYINNVYDVAEKEDSKYWEHYFANKFDYLYGNELSCILAKIVLSNKREDVLDDGDKDVLSKIITSQILRHPKNMDYVNEIFPDRKKRIKEVIVQRFSKDLKPKVSSIIDNIIFTKSQFNDIYLSSVFNEDRFRLFCDILKQKTWIIYYNTIPNIMPFTTSDNPVLVFDSASQKFGAFKVGINSKNASIIFPLSSTIAVQLCDANDLSMKISNNFVCYLDEKNINFLINMSKLSVGNSMHQAYLPIPIYNFIVND